jgi:hypothetical protein
LQAGQIGDEVRDRAEGAVGVALAFPEQEAVLLQLLEAALDGRLALAAASPSRPRRARSVTLIRQPSRCVLMSPKIPFALKEISGSRNRPLAIWVNWSAAITPRRIPAPKPGGASPAGAEANAEPAAEARSASTGAGRSVIE